MQATQAPHATPTAQPPKRKPIKTGRNMRCRACFTNGVGKKRAAYGHIICKACGEKKAHKDRKSWCVVPMHKSNYMRITDRADLLGINNKGGLVK